MVSSGVPRGSPSSRASWTWARCALIRCRAATSRIPLARCPLEPVDQHPGARILPGFAEVVVQAGQSQLLVQPVVQHLRAKPAPAGQQALFYKLLNGPAHRGAGDAKPAGERDLVIQLGPGSEPPVADRLLELLGDLVVQ